jgi:hypothetical protein
VIAVGDHLGQLGEVLPVVVTFAHDPAQLTAYRLHLGVPFPVLADPERQLYELLGAGRGTLRDVWSPGTLVMYLRLIRRGRRLRRPTEDTRQLGADAIVDRSGRLHRLWLPSGPDHRPPLDELVAALAALDH